MLLGRIYKIIIFIFLFQVTKGIAQDTLNSAIVEQKSYQLYTDKNWTELIKFGNKSIDKDYDYFYLRMRVAIAYYEKKNYCLAEFNFRKALAYNSTDDLALEYLYYCYVFTGRMEDSRKLSKTFSKALAEKIGTKKSSSIGFINLEGGTKINNNSTFFDPKTNTNQNYFNPATYFQLSLNHYVKNKFSLLHAFSSYGQQYNSANPEFNNPQIYASNDIKQLQYYLKATIPIKDNWMISPSVHVIHLKKTPDNSAYAEEEKRLSQQQQTLTQQQQALTQQQQAITQQQQTLNQQQQTLNQQQLQWQQQANGLQQQINYLQSLPQPLPPMQQNQLMLAQGDLANVQQLLNQNQQNLNNNQLQLNNNQQQFDNNQQQISNNQQQIDALNDPIKKAQDAQKASSVKKNYFVGSLTIQKTYKKLALSIGTTFSNFDNTTQLNHFGSVSYSVFGNSKLVLGGTAYFHTSDSYKTTYSSFSPFIYLQPINRFSLTASYLYNNGQNIMEDNGALVNNSVDLTTSKWSFIANVNISKHVSMYGLYQMEYKTEKIEKFNYHYNTFLVGLKIIP